MVKYFCERCKLEIEHQRTTVAIGVFPGTARETHLCDPCAASFAEHYATWMDLDGGFW